MKDQPRSHVALSTAPGVGIWYAGSSITKGAGSPAKIFVFFRIIPEQIIAAIPRKYALVATHAAPPNTASVTGLVAKENIVGTLGILYGGGDGTVYQAMAASFTLVSGYAFMAFNLLCAPCFAAMGAIKREMNNAKWFWIAVGYQCGFAYLVALVINQIGNLVANHTFGIFTVVAILVIIGFFYLLFRPYKESNTLEVKGKAVA